MKEFHESGINYVPQLRELLGLGMHYDILETHGRFNLAFDRQISQDFIVKEHEDNDTLHRFYVTSVDGDSEAISVMLDEARIPQLEEVSSNDHYRAYAVPLHAKPLLNERLFPDRFSSDTYISDREIFENLGSMWRKVFDATGKLPRGMVMAHTGMREFTPDKLFPIPPYGDWEISEDKDHALASFTGSILEELPSIYPKTGDAQIKELCGAAVKGFVKE